MMTTSCLFGSHSLISSKKQSGVVSLKASTRLSIAMSFVLLTATGGTFVAHASVQRTQHVCTRWLDTQKKSYNGHKKKHVFGIQSVTALNGMIIALGKPFRGRRHDSHALTKSRLKAYVL